MTTPDRKSGTMGLNDARGLRDLFFYGTLCHRPLLALVLGRAPDLAPARLAGWSVHRARGGAWPVILPDPAGVVQGVILRDVNDEDLARLDHYEGGFAFETRPMKIVVEGQGAVHALVYFPPPSDPDGPWSLAQWQADWAAIAMATAGDVMALWGQRSAAEIAARFPLMMVRGASRVRAAADAGANSLRRAGQSTDVRLSAIRQPYADFFAIEEYDLSVTRFDGSHGPEVTRAAFVSGDAVTVLPYDPLRDKVLLVEQFRVGPMARGDAQVWSLEPIAGRIDPGETPEQAARREAVEEAGLTLGALIKVAGYYPSPGAKAEFLYSYVALTDLPDGVAGTHGLADEAEDIRGHLIPFDQLMDLVASGEAANAPLILTALWLQRERTGLRAAATSGIDR
jgi:ADP-ribose pyrophosphatase